MTARATPKRRAAQRGPVYRSGRDVFVPGQRWELSSAALARHAVQVFSAYSAPFGAHERMAVAIRCAGLLPRNEADAHRAIDLFARLNIGDTPVARMRAAVRQVEAGRAAAAIRVHRRAA